MDPTPIKAVELVRSIRDVMYEEMKGLSAEELKAYIERKAAVVLRPSAAARMPPIR